MATHVGDTKYRLPSPGPRSFILAEYAGYPKREGVVLMIASLRDVGMSVDRQVVPCVARTLTLPLTGSVILDKLLNFRVCQFPHL